MSGYFELRIELGNEAMANIEDVRQALHYLAEGLYEAPMDRKVIDGNGNTVGTYHYEPPSAV